MKLSAIAGLRRIVNSNYDPFHVIPKPDKWLGRERLYRFTGWQYASERNTVKGGYRKMDKVFNYLNMQRKDAVKLEKHYAEERLSAALAEHNMEYKHFRNMLDQAHILLDNIVLSSLAINEPRTFKSLVSLTKEMATQEGRNIVPDKNYNKYEVHLDDSLFGEPYPKAVRFPKGAARNHTNKPRKLKAHEF